MKKVFVVIELYTFEYATDYKVSVYGDSEKAYSHFKSVVEREKKDSWIATESNVVVNEDLLSYDAYVDGYAAEFETTIKVEEKEIW